MPLALIQTLLEVIKLLLEGVAPEQRRAQARVWFLMWWPLTKFILEHNGTPKEVISQIEKDMTTGG